MMITSMSTGQRGQSATDSRHAPLHSVSRRTAAQDVHGIAEGRFLAATRDESLVRTEWLEHGLTLLKCGERSEAVRLPYSLVHAAAAADERRDVRGHLCRSPCGGAVFARPHGERSYALVSPAATRRRRGSDIEVVDVGMYLGVPAPERAEAVGLDAYWAVPPIRPGALCGPVAVGCLATTGRDAQDRSVGVGHG
jgi:hypothetical protein